MSATDTQTQLETLIAQMGGPAAQQPQPAPQPGPQPYAPPMGQAFGPSPPIPPAPQYGPPAWPGQPPQAAPAQGWQAAPTEEPMGVLVPIKIETPGGCLRAQLLYSGKAAASYETLMQIVGALVNRGINVDLWQPKQQGWGGQRGGYGGQGGGFGGQRRGW